MSTNVPTTYCPVIASSDTHIIRVFICICGGLFQESLLSALYLAYVLLCICMLATFWLSEVTTLILKFPCLLWQALLFWPQFYYTLFWPSVKGRSVWKIITDPKDVTS